MAILSALVIGLLGSLHCLGMCGPIALALPVEPGGRLSLITGRLLYNLGRVLAYAVLGGIFGLVGRPLHLGGYQQGLSICLGIIILLMVFIPARYSNMTRRLLGINMVFNLTNRFWGRLFNNTSKSARLAIGILNGFLPCGFVYVGLAGALTTGGVWQGAAYMALFGLGTVPLMLALSLIGNTFGAAFRRLLPRALPVVATILAVLFIMRGLGLGVPYLSPKITNTADVSETGSCCHPK